ncbi:MAG: O-antigen ligase family protein, partial [Anaerolineae bacterium]|nr:O-antigen ligase family protein [Anaerolineae bacterium]
MRRLAPTAVQMGVFATLICIPWWYRFRGFAGPFDVHYSLGFLIFWPMLWTILWWLIAGLPGLRTLWQDRWRRAWALALVALAVWAFFSWTWGFTRPFRPEVTLGAAIPFMLATLFALVMACAGPSARAVVGALIVGLVWNSLLAFGQAGVQGSLGLFTLGEFWIPPGVSGTSVVEADGVRWLRPYGILPHPNILAGFLVIGLLAASSWLFSRRIWKWYAGTVIVLFGLWALLLTFSRAAWLGLAAGGAFVIVLIVSVLLRTRHSSPQPEITSASADNSVYSRRTDLSRALPQIAATVACALIVATVFALVFHPFLVARTGITEEGVEQRSISDRIIFTNIAADAIRSAPLLGVGLGNFPWFAQRELNKTDFDLRGQPVHNIYLSAWSELGAIGLALLLLTLGSG